MTTTRISFHLLAGLLATVLLIAGCDEGPYKIVRLEGTVKYDGQPLENVEIFFTPEEGRPSAAFVTDGGRFKAKYSPGVMGVQAGNLRVNITPIVEEGPDGPSEMSELHKEVKEKYGHGQPGSPIEVTKSSTGFVIDLPK